MYHTIKTLLSQGHSQRKISRELGLHRKTVKRIADRIVEGAGPGQYGRKLKLSDFEDKCTSPNSLGPYRWNYNCLVSVNLIFISDKIIRFNWEFTIFASQKQIGMFSKACEYGIRAVIHISHQSQQGRRQSLKEVAKAIDSPVAFTAKILQSLANHQIITSVKGPAGGYEIPEKEQAAITLHRIVEAIDGDKIYNGCGLGLKNCNEQQPCPLHFQFKAIRDDLKSMLQTTTVAELANGLREGVSFLKR